MRIPKYLSPTSIGLFHQDTEDFYLRYLSDTKREREPQTQPMAIGSGFDAYIKNYLHEKLFGKAQTVGGDYDRDKLFEEQVEEHNWVWAREASEHVFDEYVKAGCAADLMLELGKSVGKPRFEFSVQSEIEGIPLLGKPDVFFINDEGARVIYDWKVNGYCSSRVKSPMKGYITLREKGKETKIHKDCALMKVNGVFINAGMFLEGSWADQLSIYSWLLGEEIGSEGMIAGIDQICGPKERLRFATHRLRISPDYQYNLMKLIEQIWEIIQSGWIFRELSEEDSRKRCELLDLETEGKDSLFERMTKVDGYNPR